MALTKEKIDALQGRMQALGIKEDDLIETFIQGSGKGGQKINKTSSCVQLTHIPSGIQIKCQQERSRELNRFLARRQLCDRIEEKLLGEKSKKEQEIAKIRRQKQRRSRKQKLKMIEQKRQTSEIKKLRKPPSSSND